MTKIALLALFVGERIKIKSKLEEYFNRDVEWVSPVNGSIDILVTRAKFLETPAVLQQIEKSKQNQSVKTVLTIASTREEKEYSEKIGIPSLLLAHPGAKFDQWISPYNSSASNLPPVNTDSIVQDITLNDFLLHIHTA